MMILLLSVKFLFSYVRNIHVNERNIQAGTGQGTGGFYYLVVHCNVFSLKKAGGAQKKFCFFFFKDIFLVMLKYKTEL